MQKELRFRTRYLPDLISTVIKGALTILMALAGWGVWSLAIGHVIGSVIRTFMLWRLSTYRPRARFSFRRAKVLWNYGFQLLLFNLFSVALEQADQLVISVLSVLQLSYYTVAAKIPELVTANFSLVLTQVLFPVFTKLKNDLKALTNAYLATTKYTAFITFATGFSLFITAPDLMRVVYSERWDQAIPVFQVLALLGMFYTVPWAAGDVFKAIGRPDLNTKMLLLESLYTFPMILIAGQSTGLALAASGANALAALITAIFRLYITARLLKFNVGVFIGVFRAPLIGGLGIMLAVSAWRSIAAPLPLVVSLIGSGIISLVVYGGILFLMERPALVEVFKMGKELLQRRDASKVAIEGEVH